jgi:hypothetical protein
MTDLLTRLRDLDPVAGADLTPREDLLHELLRDLPAPARRRLRPALAGFAVAAALLAGVSLLAGHGTAPGPDLAAQAYAQTDDTTGILYVRTRNESEIGTNRNATAGETWLRGKRARLRSVYDDGRAWVDLVLREDGTRHLTTSSGKDEVFSGEDAQPWHNQLGTNFVEQFRREYEQGTLDPSGTTMFNGHKAQRYVVDRSGTAPAVAALSIPATDWTSHEEYYVDASNGAPLGYVKRSSTAGGFKERITETVEQLEQLPATPENLQLLGS